MQYQTIDEVINAFTKLDLKSKKWLVSERENFPPSIANEIQNKLCMCLALNLSDEEIIQLLNITQDEINLNISNIIKIFNSITPVIKFLQIKEERKKLQYHLTKCEDNHCQISILDFPSINQRIHPNYCYFHSISNLFHKVSYLLHNIKLIKTSQEDLYNEFRKDIDYIKSVLDSNIDNNQGFSQQLQRLLFTTTYRNVSLSGVYFPTRSDYASYSFSYNSSPTNIETGLSIKYIRFYYADYLQALYNNIKDNLGYNSDIDFTKLISNDDTQKYINFYGLSFNNSFHFDNSNCIVNFSNCKFNGSSDFKDIEFDENKSIEKLCVAINNDKYTLLIKAQPNTIEWLNELLSTQNLYNQVVFRKLKHNPSDYLKKLKQLYDKTKNTNNLKYLNKFLLMEYYFEKVPMDIFNKTRIHHSSYPYLRPMKVTIENNCEINNVFSLSANELIMKNTIIQAPRVHIDAPYEAMNLINLSDRPYLFENSALVIIEDDKPDYFDFKKEDTNKQGILQHVDLSNAVFNTNMDMDALSKLNFIDCKFSPDHRLHEDPNKTNLLKQLWHNWQLKYNQKFKLNNTGTRQKLEADYRYLRKFYDNKGEYISGNDFHYNYMEQKRYNTENPIDELFLFFYKWLNGYNTKPGRGIFWLFGTPVVFLLCFSSQYNIDIKIGDNKFKNITDYNWIEQLWHLAGYLYTNILPLNILSSNDIYKVNDTKTFLITSLEHLITLIILPLIALAFYNRYRRNKSGSDDKAKE